MTGSVDAEASHRDLVYRLKRRPRMSRLVMATSMRPWRPPFEHELK